MPGDVKYCVSCDAPFPADQKGNFCWLCKWDMKLFSEALKKKKKEPPCPKT